MLDLRRITSGSMDGAPKRRLAAGRRPVDASRGRASYGVTGEEVKRRIQYYVDRLLRGAKASDLPIEQPTEFGLVLNLGTAKVLGLAVPQAVMLQAAELIR